MLQLFKIVITKRVKQLVIFLLFPFWALINPRKRKSIISTWIGCRYMPIPSLIKTLVINFNCLPFTVAKHIPILVYPGLKITWLLGKIQLPEEYYFGMIKWGVWERCRQSPKGTLNLQGLIVFKGSGTIWKGTDINVTKNAILTIGKDFLICENCSIYCTYKITIGHHLRFTYQSQMFDTDFHYSLNLETKTIKPRFAPIVIGDYVWIGNRATIKKGVVIPNHTIIAASYSLLTKNYSNIPEYSILGGCPAKLLVSGVSRAWGKDEQIIMMGIDEWFKTHPNDSNYQIPENDNLSDYIVSPHND